MAFKTHWIFNSFLSQRPGGLRWNLSAASGADSWGKAGFPVTHHRKQAAFKKERKNKTTNKSKWKTERSMNQNSPDCLSVTLRPTRGCPPDSSLAQRSLLATGHFLDSKLTIKFPLGIGGGRWKKSSQLCFQQNSSQLQCQVEAFPHNMENDQETM